MPRYIAGIDIGGTFTDCVIVDQDGRVTTAKSSSTPPDFATGIVNVLEAAAQRLDISLATLCDSLELITHGTTVGTNALIQMNGAKVGLITTKGHEDVIHIMRGSRGYTGRDIRKVVHFSEGRKPDPIVPKRMIAGVSERVDCFGNVVVELNEQEVRDAVDRLLAQGAQAIAVCLLWSFKNPAHEQRIVEIIRERAPQLFISASCDLVPKWGEYERTTAVVLNAYIGPLTANYLRDIEAKLVELGYRSPLQIAQCGGGAISVARALEAPLLTLDSGPVAGVTGSAYLGELMDFKNIITTDMGGTSFDVGIIEGGVPASANIASVNQYEYFIPKVDIQVVGAGGGSKAWIEEATKTLRVGPDSAGSRPGPVAYGRGGKVPTVTDAIVVLGYLDPENFAAGTMKLDVAGARAAIAQLAEPLGMTVDECAAGICHIVELNMADLIRKTTVQKGFDPRDFVLFAFGGAGPAHAGVFSRELGIRKVLVPQRKSASCWCAFGAASADVLHVYERAVVQLTPFDGKAIGAILEGLREQARAQLRKDGIEGERFTFSIDIRHKGQINEVEVPLEGNGLAEGETLRMVERFYERYERLYGRGSSFRGVPLEAVTFRCKAMAPTPKPLLQPTTDLTEVIPAAARRKPRSVYWAETRKREDTPVFDGDALLAGNTVVGPAIVETSLTTVVLHPGQTLTLDAFGNFDMDPGTL